MKKTVMTILIVLSTSMLTWAQEVKSDKEKDRERDFSRTEEVVKDRDAKRTGARINDDFREGILKVESADHSFSVDRNNRRTLVDAIRIDS